GAGADGARALGRGPAVPWAALRRPDADVEGAQGARVQLSLRRSGGAGAHGPARRRPGRHPARQRHLAAGRARALLDAGAGRRGEGGGGGGRAAPGYPGAYPSGLAISGLERAAPVEGAVVFHAGTRADGGRIVTAGGRVLGVTAVGADAEAARSRAYEAVSH